ncbi:MAG: hypothetical protein ACRDD1_06440, partial [Planctomycetia bacterium]
MRKYTVGTCDSNPSMPRGRSTRLQGDKVLRRGFNCFDMLALQFILLSTYFSFLYFQRNCGAT